jgi:hypothetical protein
MSADMVRAAEAAREFSVTAGVTLRLRLPTRLQMQRIVSRSGGEIAAAQEDVLLASVIGWSGINAAAIVPDAAGELAFDKALIPHVLDAYPAVSDAAFVDLISRYAKRREDAEVAAGN